MTERFQGQIDELVEIQARLQSNLPTVFRPFFEKPIPSSRGMIVLGPRGTGKTTFLLKQAMIHKYFYLSADLPLVASQGLWELSRNVFQQGYPGIVIDEVHYAPDWSQNVKAIYDAYPKKKIWVSDSNSVVLRQGIADLSRRFLKHEIPFLSFKEYVLLKYSKQLPHVDILNFETKLIQEAIDCGPVMKWFQDYLKEGFRPMFLEGEYQQRQLNIIEKTIFSDLPFFLPQVKENILRLGNAVMGMLSSSPVPSINVESTCKAWSVGKETFYQLLNAMEGLGLIRIIDYKNSKKSKTKGAKILFTDPSHYSVLGQNRGTQREAYVAFELKERLGEVFASPDEREGDFLSKDLLFEVGGLSKRKKKADYVIADDLEYPTSGKIPLWTMGLRSF
jgi:predicted AAA+ superfamily ATPase